MLTVNKYYFNILCMILTSILFILVFSFVDLVFAIDGQEFDVKHECNLIELQNGTESLPYILNFARCEFTDTTIKIIADVNYELIDSTDIVIFAMYNTSGKLLESKIKNLEASMSTNNETYAEFDIPHDNEVLHFKVFVWNNLDTGTIRPASRCLELTVDLNESGSVGPIIYRCEGIITTNAELSLCGEKAGVGEVIINGKTFKVGTTNIGDYIGYQVTFYIEKNQINNEETIIAFEINNIDVTVVNSENIESNTSYNHLVYWRDKYSDNEPTNITISDQAQIIFNGKPAQLKEDTLKPVAGQVKIVDNGSYEVVFVISNKYYVVDLVNVYNKEVTTKYGDHEIIEMDFDSKDYDLYVERDGVQLESISAICSNDVLTIQESENTVDKKIKKVFVTRNRISGIVMELSKEEIYIGGKEYKIAPGCENNVSLPEINDRVELYLTSDNKIAGIDVQVYSSYGYLVNVTRESMLRDAVLQIFSLNGSPVNVRMGSNSVIVLYRGNEVISEELSVDELVDRFSGGELQPILIKYEAQSPNGLLKKLFLAAEDLPVDVRLDYFSKDCTSINARFVKAQSPNQADKFFVEDKEYRFGFGTKVVFVPYGDKAKDINNYKLGYNFVDGGEYSIDIYELNEFNEIGVLVLKETEDMPRQLIQDASLSVVTYVGDVFDNQYGLITKVEYLQDGY